MGTLYAMQQIYLVLVLSGLPILSPYPNITFAQNLVVSAVRTKPAQIFSISLPLDLFFCCLVVFCTHNLPCYEYKGHVTYQVVCTEGLVACYTYPSTHRMPKTCRNANVEKNGGKGQTGGKNCSSTHCINTPNNHT